MGAISVVHDIRFDQVRLRNGVRLRYAEQGPRDGEPVLLLHGFSDSWYSFSRVLPYFPWNWRVIAVDQRGHGESAQPLTGYSMDRFATDALQLLDMLDIPSATVVGHCMGSVVARQMAVLAPARIPRLVLAGTCADTSQEIVLQLREAVESLTDPVDPGFICDFQMSTVHQALPAEFLNGIIAESAKLPARVWRAALDGFLAARTDLSAVRCPTLILWGDHDIFPFEQQEAVLRGIPNARLHVESDIGHSMHWEAPETFVREVAAFVNTSRRI